jgi:hypothetical protein
LTVSPDVLETGVFKQFGGCCRYEAASSTSRRTIPCRRSWPGPALSSSNRPSRGPTLTIILSVDLCATCSRPARVMHLLLRQTASLLVDIPRRAEACRRNQLTFASEQEEIVDSNALFVHVFEIGGCSLLLPRLPSRIHTDLVSNSRMLKLQPSSSLPSAARMSVR